MLRAFPICTLLLAACAGPGLTDAQRDEIADIAADAASEDGGRIDELESRLDDLERERDQLEARVSEVEAQIY